MEEDEGGGGVVAIKAGAILGVVAILVGRAKEAGTKKVGLVDSSPTGVLRLSSFFGGPSG